MPPVRPRLAAIAAALLLPLALAASAQAQIRVVSYNVAQVQGGLGDLQDVFAALNDDDSRGLAMAPAVYVMQEVQSGDAGTILNLLNNAAPPDVTYALGTYTNNNENGTAGAQAMYYRADIVAEDPSEHVDIFTGAGRRADRWRIDLLEYEGVFEAGFYIYSMHLKAGSDPENADDRETGAIAVRSNADNLPDGAHIIYAGDMNVGSSSEAAYQVFISAGPGQAVDPLGSGTWSGSAHAAKHTQSPLSSPQGGLIGGGMDDRFDLQLPSIELSDNQGLTILTGTYRAFGNDGSHYNTSINNGNNFYFPGELLRSNTLADALHDASDHIPVVVDYRIPGRFDTTIEADFGRIVQGAFASIDFSVQHGAPVQDASGTETISYTAIAQGALTGSLAGTLVPFAPADTASFTLDTSITGSRTGLILVSSPNEGVPLAAPSTTGIIVRPSAPSFSDTIDQSALTVELSFDADTGVQTFDVDVHNLNYDAVQALLDIDAIGGADAPFSFDGATPITDIGFLPAMLPFSFDTTGLAPGLYTDEVVMLTSDEDIPGESTGGLLLTIEVTIDGNVNDCPIDLNIDGFVGFADLSQLLASWGTCVGCAADFDEDGMVGFSDLSTLLAAWGTCP